MKYKERLRKWFRIKETKEKWQCTVTHSLIFSFIVKDIGTIGKISMRSLCWIIVQYQLIFWFWQFYFDYIEFFNFRTTYWIGIKLTLTSHSATHSDISEKDKHICIEEIREKIKHIHKMKNKNYLGTLCAIAIFLED